MKYRQFARENKKYISLAVGAVILWAGAYAIGKLDTSKNEVSSSAETAKIIKPSKLYFSPESVSVSKGSEFSIDAMIDPLENEIVAVELKIRFDNDKMTLDRIEAEKKVFGVTLAEPLIDNKNGEASVILGISPTPFVPAVDISKIATFVFLAKDEVSESPIEFMESSRAAAKGELGNVIDSRTACRVTIQ